MAHAPAKCFKINKRGFIREGYWADLVLLDLNKPQTVEPSNIYCKAAWSPFEGKTFNDQVYLTMVSGQIVYKEGNFTPSQNSQRLTFDRN